MVYRKTIANSQDISPWFVLMKVRARAQIWLSVLV